MESFMVYYHRSFFGDIWKRLHGYPFRSSLCCFGQNGNLQNIAIICLVWNFEKVGNAPLVSGKHYF